MTWAVKTNKRIPPDNDIISKCGADNPEKECVFFERSRFRQDCMYKRFGFVCERLVITNSKEEESK